WISLYDNTVSYSTQHKMPDIYNAVMKVQDKSSNKLIGFISLVVVIITMITSDHLLIYAQTVEDQEDWNESYRNAGFKDGQNEPFNDATYDHCRDETTGDKA
ncbi:MAG: hypothetical protein ACRD5J_13415, partial [Nitrososphaeraceae archaeon]